MVTQNFLKIKLNSFSENILSFWEKEFNSSLEDHIDFLKKNIENQEIYNSKFSEILSNMDIFDTENDNYFILMSDFKENINLFKLSHGKKNHVIIKLIN